MVLHAPFDHLIVHYFYSFLATPTMGAILNQTPASHKVIIHFPIYYSTASICQSISTSSYQEVTNVTDLIPFHFKKVNALLAYAGFIMSKCTNTIPPEEMLTATHGLFSYFGKFLGTCDLLAGNPWTPKAY